MAGSLHVDCSKIQDETRGGASVADTDQFSAISEGSHLHRSAEAAQLRAMRLRQEMLLREAEECTFHPRTNIGCGGSKPVHPEAFFQRSQQWRDQIAHETEERRRKLEERDMAHCTFTPRVTPRRVTKSNEAT